MIPPLEWWQWMIGAICAFLIGASKTGLPGLGVMVVPMMVLMVGDARQSAGWLLPILCTADLLAVWYWRKNAAAGRLFALAPWVLAGIAAGAAALALSERVLRPMIGVIIFVMLAIFLYRKYRGGFPPAPHPALYGTAAGFATTVANAAGPVMSLYLLSKRLPKEDFVATGAWFFFFVNLAKVPIYAYHGLFGRQSLTFDALLAPAILAGAFTGRALLHSIPPRLFEALVIAMTVVGTALLFR
jgi:uncharacterized membrane protein YfcA